MGVAVIKLNLGCGEKILDGWINVDNRAELSQKYPIVVCDLNEGLPADDGTVDEILLDNVLEHFASDDAIRLLNRIGRALKSGGKVKIIVPHAHSQGAFQDPTHKSFWVPRSYLYWSNVYTPFGGKTVGITANLILDPSFGLPVVSGDMETEAFITFNMIKGG